MWSHRQITNNNSSGSKGTSARSRAAGNEVSPNWSPLASGRSVRVFGYFGFLCGSMGLLLLAQARLQRRDLHGLQQRPEVEAEDSAVSGVGAEGPRPTHEPSDIQLPGDPGDRARGEVHHLPDPAVARGGQEQLVRHLSVLLELQLLGPVVVEQGDHEEQLVGRQIEVHLEECSGNLVDAELEAVGVLAVADRARVQGWELAGHGHGVLLRGRGPATCRGSGPSSSALTDGT